MCPAFPRVAERSRLCPIGQVQSGFSRSQGRKATYVAREHKLPCAQVPGGRSAEVRRVHNRLEFFRGERLAEDRLRLSRGHALKRIDASRRQQVLARCPEQLHGVVPRLGRHAAGGLGVRERPRRLAHDVAEFRRLGVVFPDEVREAFQRRAATAPRSVLNSRVSKPDLRRFVEIRRAGTAQPEASPYLRSIARGLIFKVGRGVPAEPRI